MERDIHVALVLEVEKYECIYNTTLPEYARKEETEKAWSEISNTIQLPISECKDKWRNIRSTFRRSFKPTRNSKPKRTYYLSRYLNFIVPYSKPMDDSIFREDSTQDGISVVIKDEDSGQSADDEERPEQSNWQDYKDTDADKLNPLSNSSEEEFSMPEHLRTNDSNFYQNEKEEHMRYFFMSLLPEFGNMSEQQTRTFKIRVLQLIDDIKSNSTTSSVRK